MLAEEKMYTASALLRLLLPVVYRYRNCTGTLVVLYLLNVLLGRKANKYTINTKRIMPKNVIRYGVAY